MRLKRLALGFGIFAALLAVLVLGLLLMLAIGRGSDREAQKRGIESLAALPSDPGSPALVADRALDEGLSLDRIRMLATHNSYRKRADPLRRFLIGLAEPEQLALLDYAHPPLFEQLESGIRSLELDLRLKGRRFELVHVPLVDDRSVAPDFRLALKELRLWSERRPGHAPLLLILELKEDYAFLDPGLKPFDAAAFELLDAELRAGLGQALFEPDELRAGAPSLAAALASRGWPRLGGLRGRILVILHENEHYRRLYTEGRPSLEGRAMFDCAPAGAPDESFAILNEPAALAEAIADRLSRGIIVRTRADADGAHSASALTAALGSGAQIVSTDFPPAYPAPDGYFASLPGALLLAPSD